MEAHLDKLRGIAAELKEMSRKLRAGEVSNREYTEKVVEVSRAFIAEETREETSTD